MLILGMVGCWWAWPETSNEQGFLGKVVDASGAPVVGLKVENLESSEKTNEDGLFGLYYKAPDLHVGFSHQGGFFRRSFLPSDENTTVQIALPEMRRGQLDCGPFTCRAQLTWTLGPGYTFKHVARCSGEPVVIEAMPPGDPAVSCKAKVTDPEESVVLVRDGDTLRLRPAPRAVTVTLEADGTPSGPCTVTAAGVAGALKSEGVFVVPVTGAAMVQARCDGRAALPTPIGADSTTATVTWSSEGPTLQPPPGMVLDQLRIQTDGWSLQTTANKEGAFLLPPLPAGHYAVQLFANAPEPVPLKGTDDLKPGSVYGQMLASGVYAGELLLETDMAEGVLDIR